MPKKPSWLENLRRAELRRLLLHRRASPIQVANMVEDIIAERAKWSADALGRRLDLTFATRFELGIRTIACTDRSKEMVKLFFVTRKRERDRLRVNKKRALNRITRGLSPRARELLAVLPRDWTRSAALDDKVRNIFLGGVRAGKLKREALRSAVLRAAGELRKRGFAEQKFDVGPRGGRVLFFRRSKANSATANSATAKTSRLTGEVQQNRAFCPEHLHDGKESLHRIYLSGDSEEARPPQSGGREGCDAPLPGTDLTVGGASRH